ncbi:MAG: hypothetical protein ACI9HK_005490 [Pirellulaceae bacterium]
MLLQISAASNLCCFKSLLLQISAASNLCCFKSLLLQISAASNLCCFKFSASSKLFVCLTVSQRRMPNKINHSLDTRRHSSAASARTPPARIIHQRFHGDFFCLTVKPPQNLGKDNVSNPWHTSLAHNLQWNNETGLPRNWPAEKLACRETGLPRQNLTQIRTKGQYHHQWDTRLARDADATSLMPQSHATVSCHSLAVVAILNPSLFSIQVFSQSKSFLNPSLFSIQTFPT